MDIERKITKKHIIIGIASLVFVIGLALTFTACNGGNSGKENTVVEETATITSTTTTATEITTNTTTTTKVTTTTTEITTTECTTTEKITETTITTKRVEENRVINDETNEPEYVETKRPTTSTTKATTTETKKTSITTTAKPVETEKPVTTTEAPVSSSHYYGEICNNPTDSGWSRINGCWSYVENYGWYFSSLFSDSNAASWVESTGYMKPTYVPEVIEGCAVNVATWVWLQ